MVLIYGCLNCFVTTISAFPILDNIGKERLTIPVGPASWASNNTPFIEIATYAFSSVVTIKEEVPIGVAPVCVIERTGGKTSLPQIFVDNRYFGGLSELKNYFND